MSPTADPTGIAIGIERPPGGEVRGLFAESDRYLASLYPAESNHLVSLDELEAPGATVLTARREGQVIGCVALIARSGEYGEMKRLYVSAQARGSGCGRRLLQALEQTAGEAGLSAVRLETGIRQPEALALYESAGYSEIGPFADYRPDPLSVFMEKRL